MIPEGRVVWHPDDSIGMMLDLALFGNYFYTAVSDPDLGDIVLEVSLELP